MITIEFEGNLFKMQDVGELIRSDVKDYHAASYLYGTYGPDLLKGLYLAQNRCSAISATILFQPEDTDNLLRHINIFSTFSFTLVPTKIDPGVYKRIYDFFMYSPLSVTYVTWMSSLILKPARIIREIRIDGKRVIFPSCQGSECFLAHRNCSKGLVFQQLFHPERGVPTEKDMESFCGIQRSFSEMIARDLSSQSEKAMETFRTTRKSLGIERQYWVDPLNIYAGVQQ